MKRILIVLCSMVLLQGCASFKTISTNKTERVITLNGVKDDLFVKANAWMVEQFNSAKSVIQFQDKESGVVMGKYLLNQKQNYSNKYSYNDVYATIKIQLKDNSAKITIIPRNDWQVITIGGNNYEADDAKKDMNRLIESFKTYMNKKDSF